MIAEGKHARRAWVLASLSSAILALAAFWSVGFHNFRWFRLLLGSDTMMTSEYAYFLVFWAVLGSLAAMGFARAYAILGGTSWAQESYEALRAIPDSRLVAGLSMAGFVIPLLIRSLLLRGADLTDDETIYRFSSELLLGGRLYVSSPPMKLFFDHVFMINDGKFYSQYFMGWPALLAPGVALGVPGLMNPLYSALTVPAIFLTLRDLGGRWCAVVGIFIFLCSPMVQITAATQLSHTSCMFTLAWMLYFVLRVSRGDSSPWLHPAVAVAFSLAFFNRPAAAAAMGAPLLALWALSLRSLGLAQRWRALVGFAAPAALFGAAFLAVNAVQNGSITYVSYQRAGDYARENAFHFATWTTLPDDWRPSFGFGALDLAFARIGVALTRLNFALFGWPIGFLFLPFASLRGQRAWILWLMMLGFVLVHGYVRGGGIDTFGPVHFAELALPIVLLSALGITRLTGALRGGHFSPVVVRLPLALCLGLATAAACGYVPVRAKAINTVTPILRRPALAAQKLEGPAIVFATRPLLPWECLSARPFVRTHEVNDPDFENPVLWANHLSIEHDRRLMEIHPEREGFLLHWRKDCQAVLVPLDEAAELNLPAVNTGGSTPVPAPHEMR